MNFNRNSNKRTTFNKRFRSWLVWTKIFAKN